MHYFEAKQEGLCDTCERDECLCVEEGRCLKKRTLYTIYVHFIENVISIDTYDLLERDNIISNLCSSMNDGKAVKIQNVYVNGGKILYFKVEEYK